MEKNLQNPWLSIPASDYEAHMNSPAVEQLSLLSREFGLALSDADASNVAIFGCATGNGFEHIDPSLTRRLTAVDVNPEYCSLVEKRFGDRIPGLEVLCGDIHLLPLDKGAYSFIHAGLLLEYVAVEMIIGKAAGSLIDGGHFHTVLQLPDKNHSRVTRTSYVSLKKLSGFMHLTDPGKIDTIAANCGLHKIWCETKRSTTGKSFRSSMYRKQ
jgi:SAM-dependent methyltransferase